MFKKILLPLLFIGSTQAFAACQPDTLELGDIGPGGKLACEILDNEFQTANSTIVGRKIVAADQVDLNVMVNGRHELVSINLSGADWQLVK